MKKSNQINYVESFPKGSFSASHLRKLIKIREENESKKKAKAVKVLLASVDTEYTNKNANENICISWQTSVINMETAEFNSNIKYVDYINEERLTLEEVLFFVFAVGGVKKSNINGYHVILVGHFFTAEWAMLKNREAIFPHCKKRMNLATNNGNTWSGKTVLFGH